MLCFVLELFGDAHTAELVLLGSCGVILTFVSYFVQRNDGRLDDVEGRQTEILERLSAIDGGPAHFGKERRRNARRATAPN